MVSLVPSCAAALPVRPVLMSFWADQGPLRRGFPVPAFRAQLNDVDVLAYAFLEVDAAGNVYFRNPAVDLSAQDLAGFCARHPADCPGDARAADGSFDAFTRLQNRTGTLRKIISVGGAHSQKTMDHVLAQPARFVRSVAALVSAYHLDGVDLDFEPNSFFFRRPGPPAGRAGRCAQICAGTGRIPQYRAAHRLGDAAEHRVQGHPWVQRQFGRSGARGLSFAHGLCGARAVLSGSRHHGQ